MNKSKQTSQIYDKIAEDYAKAFSEPSEYVDEFITLLPKNAKILDIGCGVGIDTNYISSKNFKVIGIDLSKEMLKIAKQKFPKIEFKQQDIKELNIPNNSFDGIFASFSLIHITKKDFPIILNKIYNILKKEGILYIGLQEGKSEEIWIDEPFKPDEKLFLNIISFEEIKKLLSNNKLTIIEKYERKPKSKEEINYTKLYLIIKK